MIIKNQKMINVRKTKNNNQKINKNKICNPMIIIKLNKKQIINKLMNKKKNLLKKILMKTKLIFMRKIPVKRIM